MKRIARLVLLAGSTSLLAGVGAGSTGYGLWDAYMVPGAAHLPGDQGTFWRTDVAILNPYADHAVSVTVRFCQELRDNTGAPEHSYDIPAGGQLLLEDVVGQVFGVQGKGALHITADGGDYLVVSARTYTGATATYGQTINGQSWVNGGGDRALIAGIRNAGPFRTNVGAVNWSDVPVNVRAEAFDAAGALKGSRTFALLPWSNEQVGIASFAGAFASGYVKWTCLTEAGDAAWLAYASVVDNSTGDAVFLEDRADDVRTYLDPTYDLSGTWEGLLQTTGFSEYVVMRVFHYAGSVTAYLYDEGNGYRVGTLYGATDGVGVAFTGRSDILDNVHDQLVGTGVVGASGWSISGTFSGTGSYAAGGTFSFTKVSSSAGVARAAGASTGVGERHTAGRARSHRDSRRQ